MSRTAIMIIAAVLGVLWIVLATASLISAFQGLAAERHDWLIGWGLVGVLLLGAGAAALVGTWNHLFRVTRAD